MRERKDHQLYVSAMTIAGLHRGVAKLPASRRRGVLATWLEQLEAGFEDRVLAFGCETGHVWARICAG
jgi:hypothetical protein